MTLDETTLELLDSWRAWRTAQAEAIGAQASDWAMLSVGSTHLFLDNMTAGRGYIALAIVILGHRRPIRVMLGSLLFGAAAALQLRAQASGMDVPFQFLLMLPCLLTIVVLAALSVGHTLPSALGRPYPDKESV